MRCFRAHLYLPFLAVGLMVFPSMWPNRLLATLFPRMTEPSQASLFAPFAEISTQGPLSLLLDSTFLGQYKWRIIGATVLVALQSLLIVGLLVERNRKRAAARSLAESEERYRNVVETQTELICRYLPDTTLTFVNDAYCRYFSRSRDELIGSKFIELLPIHTRASTQQLIRDLLANAELNTHEHEVIKPGGTIGWHRWTNRVISHGGQAELQGIGRDITERKRVEEALVVSEGFNRGIVESSTDCIKLLDLDGNLVYMSENGRQLLEIDDFEELKGKSWIQLWSGVEKEQAQQAVKLAAEEKAGSFQGFALTFKGTPKWWHTVITPVRGTNGNVERLLAVSRDITKLELAHQAVEESERRFARAFRSNPQPMSITTLIGGRYIDVNESFLNMSGFSRDEVIGHTSRELNIFETPAHRNTVLVDPLLSRGANRYFEMNFRTKTGDFRVLLSSAELIDLGGEKCILVASSDISERKALEEDLRLSEREFSTLVENSPDIICRLDRNLRFIYASPAIEKVVDVSAEQLIGKRPTEFDFDDQASEQFEASCRQAIDTRKTVQRAFEYRSRNFWTRIVPEFSIDGDVESLMMISEDVTDRIRSEQELVQLTIRLFNIQDEERRRIARELHDGTAQNLFAISVNLAKLGQLPTTESLEQRQLVDECQSLCDQSLQEIRTLSYLLHPPLLDQAGLVSALQWYVEGFRKRSGVYVDVMATPIGRLPGDVEMALFRVVQEALTNVRRHARSATASIRLERKNGHVILEIKDQGRGIPLLKRRDDSGSLIETGVGIPGMRQRLLQLGGRLEIVTHDQGTTVSAIVPITNGVNHGSNTSSRRS
ncbi:MAG: hypothetical protein DMF69_14730 [Acidobacteria bacterium]|nr:MAG: hypothetical protein DMF69_14730 [Acidobacteriota bacterium]